MNISFLDYVELKKKFTSRTLAEIRKRLEGVVDLETTCTEQSSVVCSSLTTQAQIHRFKELRENYSAKVHQLLTDWMRSWENTIEMMTMFEIKQILTRMENTLESLIAKFLRDQATLTQAAKVSPEFFLETCKDDLSDSLLGIRSNGTRRGVYNKRIPERSIKVLKSWLEQNQDDPYPSQEEKKLLSASTGLSMKQITNWFINKRCKLSVCKYKKKKRGLRGVCRGEHRSK